MKPGFPTGIAAESGDDAGRRPPPCNPALCSILDAVVDSVIVIDENGIIEAINLAGQRLFGYAADELIGANVKLLMPEPYRGEHDEYLRRYKDTGRRRVIGIGREAAARAKDGQVFPIELSVNDLHLSGRRLFVGVIRDISLRRRTEAALRESEARYRLLAEYANDVIARLSPEGLFTYVSPASANLFGFEPAELEGASVFALAHPADVETLRRAFDGVLGHYTVETVSYRAKDREGNYLWLEASLRGVRGGDSARALEIVAVLRDVNDRVLATEAANRFKHVLDETLDMIFLFEPDTLRFVYMNKGAIESLGYSREELLQMTPEQIKPLLSETEFRRLIEPLLAGDVPSLSFETLHRRKDGVEFPVEIFLQFVKEEGEKGLFVALVRDIRERRQTEEVIRGLNRHLRQRNLELEATNAELESFSYSVSHDLRAPLRAIDGFSDALLEEWGDRMDDMGRDYLGRVKAGTRRMGDLIDDLLDLARVTRHRMRFVRMDLSRMAEQVVAELAAVDPERRVRFVIAPGMTAEGDPGLIGIVLENLLGNAWKYTSKHASARIEFGLSERDGERVYFVRDDGAGFDMAYVDKLFGAFQRLHGAHEFPGTGIGLATAHRIIRRHGGRIWAEGEAEKGATFYFSLPSRPSDQEAE